MRKIIRIIKIKIRIHLNISNIPNIPPYISIISKSHRNPLPIL